MDDSQLAYVRRRIFTAVGLAPVVASSACGGLVVFVEEDGAGGSGGGTTGVSVASGTTQSATSTASTGCPMVEMVPTVCYPQPAGGCPTGQAAETKMTEHLNATCVPQDPEFCWCQVSHLDVLCGPFSKDGGDCCYLTDYTLDELCEGRPFTVAGAARVAPVESGGAWPRPVSIDCAALDLADRRALAAAWARTGQYEHASAASFARVVLELLSLGAPRDLVAAAQEAGADETEHAALAFGIASALAGEALGPGRLDVSGALRTDALAIVEATVREGCIGETISAIVALAARDAAQDPVVIEALSRIAADELRHAELAWQTVAWAIGSLPGAREAALVAFAASFTSDELDDDGIVDADAARAFGILPRAERARLAADALAAVIRPSEKALFAGPTRPAGPVSLPGAHPSVAERAAFR